MAISRAAHSIDWRLPPLFFPSGIFSLNFIKRFLQIIEQNWRWDLLSKYYFVFKQWGLISTMFSKNLQFLQQCLKIGELGINLLLKFTRFHSFETISPCDTTLKFKQRMCGFFCREIMYICNVLSGHPRLNGHTGPRRNVTHFLYLPVVLRWVHFQCFLGDCCFLPEVSSWRNYMV